MPETLLAISNWATESSLIAPHIRQGQRTQITCLRAHSQKAKLCLAHILSLAITPPTVSSKSPGPALGQQ